MIERAEMIRLESGDDGTFGVMRINGKVMWVTLEPPQRGNARDISCIPAGEYVCRKIESPAFGETFEIEGVPGRSHILFHAGNVSGDTRGCVLLGQSFGALRGARGVLRSRAAVREFMDRCSGVESFPLSVDEVRKEGVWKVSA